MANTILTKTGSGQGGSNVAAAFSLASVPQSGGKRYAEVRVNAFSVSSGSTLLFAAGIYRSEVGAETSGSAVYEHIGMNFRGDGITVAFRGHQGNDNQSQYEETQVIVPPLEVGDIIGMALEASNGKVWLSHNGTFVMNGDPANGINPTFILAEPAASAFPSRISGYVGSANGSPAQIAISTAQTFYARPSGFIAWE